MSRNSNEEDILLHSSLDVVQPAQFISIKLSEKFWSGSVSTHQFIPNEALAGTVDFHEFQANRHAFEVNRTHIRSPP